MKRVFIGGSRKISRLTPEIRKRLDQIIERQMHVVVGDANGADRAVQAYLHQRGYPHVVVFCSGGSCRNNVGQWRVEPVAPPHKARDFAFFAAKDAAMTTAADAGLMLWDGTSSGTIVNVARMLATGKTTLVYLAEDDVFYTIRSTGELNALLANRPRETQGKLARYISEHAGTTAPQSSLFEAIP